MAAKRPAASTQVAQPAQRLRAVVHGRVQGVNFRYYTLRAAQQLGLTGWVGNRWDGTVETVAEGRREALERFREFLQRGSPGSFVEHVDVDWLPGSSEFSTFRIRYL